MSALDALFVSVFNISGKARQGALVEAAASLLSHLFYVLKNRRVMGADNVTYNRRLDELQRVGSELVSREGKVTLVLRHESLYVNGCLIPRGAMGQDEVYGYLGAFLAERQVEEIHASGEVSREVVLSLVGTLEDLPRSWPASGEIAVGPILLLRRQERPEEERPEERQARARWAYERLHVSRCLMGLGTEDALRDGLRTARRYLYELVELGEESPQECLDLLRRSAGLEGESRRDVNTAVITMLVAQRLSLPRRLVLTLAHGGLLHRWIARSRDGDLDPTVASASALLRSGGVNPFNFSLMVLLQQRWEEGWSHVGAAIVRTAARFEDLRQDGRRSFGAALRDLMAEIAGDGRIKRLLAEVVYQPVKKSVEPMPLAAQ